MLINAGTKAIKNIKRKLLFKNFIAKKAKRGPKTAPKVSKARWNPKVLPRSKLWELSAIKASFAAILTPFPNLSIKRANKTQGQTEAKAKNIFDITEQEYPKTIKGFLF